MRKEIVGGRVTTKLDALVPVPAGFVTWIAPVVAVAGTVAVICVSEFTVKLAAVPAKLTPVVPVKAVPVMVTTVVPAGPFVGVNEVMEGTTITTKLDELVPVPWGFVITWIAPVVAPVGTVAVICVSEFTVNVAAIPAKVTAVAPVKPLPVMVTPPGGGTNCRLTVSNLVHSFKSKKEWEAKFSMAEKTGSVQSFAY